MSKRGKVGSIAWLAASVALTLPALADDAVRRGEDYPTVVVADYVLGCMKANEETRKVLEQCSCSIDVISTLIPYTRYEEAETYLSLGQISGERGVIFRTSEESKAAVQDLRRAQVEAELRCF
ncbi:hypothetical protein [Acuticoccus sp. I52.16.1]|uniref:hypothetical protein n=1 Tax=Acuticoccus sp. I52.16.1 TaxID=2928472 RepID=UPI001FD36811|nr:hypothetical protein [Acuticoccus sp. I52.16.1]UOM35448.1 hypothetical protein MRB58_04360 [Acuticoccus sp. I52.16.1]